MTAFIAKGIINILSICRKWFTFLILALLFSCHERRPWVIVIQPLGNFTAAQAKTVYAGIKQVNANTILLPAIPMPDAAWYAARQRYRADTLIRYLGRRVHGDTVIIGLTNEDISSTKDNIPDWGIMGLGYCPGNACVASTYRLTKSNMNSQFYKVALHELGHTQGLPHCKNKTCFMRDAEGGNPLDEERGFCESCTTYLRKKGWVVK